METTATQPAAMPTTPPAPLPLPMPASGTPQLQITESAIERLRIVAAEQGVELVGVRVGVTGGGCSGLSYVLDFETSARLGDSVFGESPQ